MGGGGGISLTAWERGPGEPLACGLYSAPQRVFKCPSGTVQHGIISAVAGLFFYFQTASFPVGIENIPSFPCKCSSKILAAKSAQIASWGWSGVEWGSPGYLISFMNSFECHFPSWEGQ